MVVNYFTPYIKECRVQFWPAAICIHCAAAVSLVTPSSPFTEVEDWNPCTIVFCAFFFRGKREGVSIHNNNNPNERRGDISVWEGCVKITIKAAGKNQRGDRMMNPYDHGSPRDKVGIY